MKNLYRFLFLAAFLGLVPLSCERCKFSEVADFEILEMGISTINTKGDTIADSTVYHYPQDIAIEISVTDQRTVSLEATPLRFTFTNAAYACSPPTPLSTQSIEAVEITAAKSFSYSTQYDTVQAGQNISDKFQYSNGRPSGFDSLNDFLNWHTFLDPFGSFYIQLTTAPYQPTDIIVDITVTLSDQSTFAFNHYTLKVK